MKKTSCKFSVYVLVLILSIMLLSLINETATAVDNVQGSIPLSPNQVPATAKRIKTNAYMSFRPNPIGVGQIFLVNLWIVPPTHKSRYLSNYTVTIVKPSGKTEVIKLDSYPADATAWFEYLADEPGTWKIKFEFPGGYFREADLPGAWDEPPTVHLGECYYEPSSTGWQELIVLENYTAQSWPPSPLPVDYWTRPIQPLNREWWWIAGHYPWRGPGGGPGWEKIWDELYPNTNKYWSDRYNFIPWVKAPESAHIVWKQQRSLAGLLGPISSEQTKFISTYAGMLSVPLVIYQGRCYESVTSSGGRTVFRCYDLRTGETIWEISPDPTPMTLFLGVFSMRSQWYLEYNPGVAEVPGAEAQHQVSVSLVSIGGGRLLKLDPWSGAINLNASISPLTTGTYYRNGYVLSVQSTNPFWPFMGPPPQYFLINWTTIPPAPAGWWATTTFNLKDCVVSNITWPLGDSWNVCYDFESGIAVAVESLKDSVSGVWIGTRARAASLKDGRLLWDKTFEETNFSPMCVVADHGKVAFLTNEGYWIALRLTDGKIVWKSDRMDYPWDACGFGGYAVSSAYGLFYRFGYSGVYAFDWETGKIVWKFEAPAEYPYETPYIGRNGTTVYSFMSGGLIADGKIFVYNTEHTPTQPITRGWKLYCLDAKTGECLWKITGSMIPCGIADGYLVALNGYDGYMYCFGRGKSQTSISVSKDVVAVGETVLIKGNVLDMSPAQPGTPCVAKESMTAWMEYLHMQKPMPSEVKGVPVTLMAIKDDGEVIDLGVVTTNGFYGTFALAWTPEKEGTYTIVASFEGDESYGSSSAATFLHVISVSAQKPPEAQAYTTMDLAIIIAVTIAIIIGIVNLYIVLKKR